MQMQSILSTAAAPAPRGGSNLFLAAALPCKYKSAATDFQPATTVCLQCRVSANTRLTQTTMKIQIAAKILEIVGALGKS